MEQKPIYNTYEDYPVEDLLLYAGIDCITTSEILAATFPRIIEQPLYVTSTHGKLTKGKIPSILEAIRKYEMPAFEFICDLELNGIEYDIELNRQMNRQMEAEIASLEHSIFTAIGHPVDLDSGAALGDFLYGELGLTPPFLTKTGSPSTDGDALAALVKSARIPYLADIAKRNDIASAHRTFIKTYVEDHVKPDGRVHPSYNLHGTSSFRITGDNPNLTQLPRPKHGYNVRRCFKVADGNVFIALDFSSAEVKILGALCKDPTLLKAIEEGKDFHSFSASAMRRLDYDEFISIVDNPGHPLYKEYKGYRQAAKALTFGINLGAIR
jgi:DNA polymerase I-like protein with 3'-5' exonuclease and polymerase domains